MTKDFQLTSRQQNDKQILGNCKNTSKSSTTENKKLKKI